MPRLNLPIAALAALAATPALAHHPLGGMPMETFAHGVLSGVGHPLLGFDHLFFVIGVGILAAASGHARTGPLGYLAGMMAGVVLSLGLLALPAAEVAIALSLVAVGMLLMRGRGLALLPALGLFALLGLFHGWAFGGALAAQEGAAGTAVLAGYLAGLAITQYLIAIAAGFVLSLLGTRLPTDLAPRLAGGVVAGAGALLVLEMAESAAFSALGWS